MLIKLAHSPLKTRVNLLFLNGTCCSLFPFAFLASKALMHSFNANKLLLISAPSANLLLLLLWVSVALSLPAKSINVIFPVNISVLL